MMWFGLLPLLFVAHCICSELSYRSPNTCSYPRLEHGRVRMRQKAKLVKFTCFIHYELVGNKYATCRDGEWDVPLPICVRPGCTIPKVENGVQMPMRQGAFVVFFCLPGFRLVGSAAIYCDGRRWNDTSPSCVDESNAVKLSCDFEEADMCGWTQDLLHDFDWKRLNKETPSSFLFTGPSFDHTFGKGGSGYYMYIESTSKMENDTARLISPIYDGALAKNGCFSFFYHMYGKSTGGLRVYQKPENFPMQLMLRLPKSFVSKKKYLLFEKWGNLGDFWFNAVTPLVDFSDNFQIVIEGIRGSSFTSDIAIDDVAILQGNDCIIANESATTPMPALVESCVGRCDTSADVPSGVECGCSSSCVTSNNCCPDFFEVCAFPDPSTTVGGDENVATSGIYEPAPQTQKLVATTPENTTWQTKTTTTKTTPTTSTKLKPSTETTLIASTNKTFLSTTKKLVTLPTLVFKSPTPAYNATGRLQKDGNTTMRNFGTTKAKSTTVKFPISKVTSPTAGRRKVTKADWKPTIANVYKALRSENNSQNASKAGSNAFKAIASIVLIAAVCAIGLRAAVLLRGASAQATLARLRGRATQDSSVRYLTSYEDDE